MKKDRVAGIVIKDEKILLMFRINNGKEYYTFPGGGIEPGESHIDAVERELLEETSIKIKVVKLLYEVDWDYKTKQFFYLCEYKTGTPLLGDYNEMAVMADGTQYYDPKWIELSDISQIIIYPLEIKDLMMRDMETNFKIEKRNLFLCLNTCRQII